MKKQSLLLSIVAVLLFITPTLGARGFFDSVEYSIRDLDFTNAGPIPLPTYLGVGAEYYGWNIDPEVDTSIFLHLQGGRRYKSFNYTPQGAPLGERSSLIEGSFGGRIGMEQGLFWNNRTNENLLSVYAALAPSWSNYYVRKDKPNYIIGSSEYDFIEEAPIITLTFLTGLLYDDVYKNMHSIRDGLAAEFYTEFQLARWSQDGYKPGSWWNIGAGASYYLPVFDITDEWDELTFAGEFSARVIMDYMLGYTNATLLRRGTTGGLTYATPRLGGAIRGYESHSYDGNFMIALNTEFNLLGPQIALHTIYPKFSLFFDAGYTGYTEGGSYTVETFERNHMLMSTGFEIGLSILEGVQPGMRLAFPLTAERSDSKKVVVEFMLEAHL